MPVSHSRAIVSEVRRAAMIIRITEIKPGTMKFFDSSDVLSLNPTPLSATRITKAAGLLPTHAKIKRVYEELSETLASGEPFAPPPPPPAKSWGP